ETFRVFYSINPGKISYMNIPRFDDMKVFKNLMVGRIWHRTSYEQDMATFFLNPNKLPIENPIPELYEEIQILPLVTENINFSPDILITEAPLPGAFADHKFYFKSSRSYLAAEINQRL